MTCKCDKTVSIAILLNIPFPELPEKPLHVSVKAFSQYMDVFAACFSLHNLKGNGNALSEK